MTTNHQAWTSTTFALWGNGSGKVCNPAPYSGPSPLLTRQTQSSLLPTQNHLGHLDLASETTHDAALQEAWPSTLRFMPGLHLLFFQGWSAKWAARAAPPQQLSFIWEWAAAFLQSSSTAGSPQCAASSSSTPLADLIRVGWMAFFHSSWCEQKGFRVCVSLSSSHQDASDPVL